MTDPVTRVLLIDDEPNLLLGLSAVMKRAGLEVLTASNGSVGLAKIIKHQPDIIVCDVMMPPPNGFDLKRKLESDPVTARIPFIFLTARSNSADRIAGLRGGADDYVTKPFKVDELIEKVHAVLRRHQRGREQGLSESEGQVDQLRRFLGLAAQWIPSDLSSVTVSGPAGETQNRRALTVNQLVEILDTIGSELNDPMGVICLHLAEQTGLGPEDAKKRRELASRLIHAAVAREHYMFQVGSNQSAVFIPHVHDQDLPAILEQLRARTEKFNADHDSLAPIRFAIGAFVGEPGRSLRQLWEKADSLMRARIMHD